MARWGTSWTDYAEAVINPAGSTAHIAEDISESIAAAREAQAEAKAAKAAAAAQARADAAAARAAEAEAGARVAEAERQAAESRKATPGGGGGGGARRTAMRDPSTATLGRVGGSDTSPTVWLVAGGALIIGAVYYYSRKKR